MRDAAGRAQFQSLYALARHQQQAGAVGRVRNSHVLAIKAIDRGSEAQALQGLPLHPQFLVGKALWRQGCIAQGQ